jgi:hypothetical protein
MSTRSFRARLDRLEQSAKGANGREEDHTGNFTIDLAVAKALRDDLVRQRVLYRKKASGILSAAETEEEHILVARINDTAQKTGCPPGYKVKETEYPRLLELRSKRDGGGTLSEAEDIEEAQLTAQAEASSNARLRAWCRMMELICRQSGVTEMFTPAEQDELNRLQALFPDTPPDPNSPRYHIIEPLYSAIMACRASNEKERVAGIERQRQSAERRRLRRTAEE